MQGYGIRKSSCLVRYPGERLDPEATHSPPEVLVFLVHLWEEMGRLISCLDSVSCLASWWAHGVGPTLASSEEPHVPLLRQ